MGLLDGFRKGTPEQRAELKEAKKQVNNLEKELELHARPQRMAFESASRQHEQEIAATEAKLKDLENPLYGELVSSLGSLFLFEHVLIQGTSPTNYNTGVNSFGLLLEGVSVTVESAGEYTYIYFDLPGGERRMLSFSGSRDPEVRRFALEIEQAIKVENRFRKAHPELLRGARAHLESLRTDTTSLANLWDVYQQALVTWPKGPELAAARARLETAQTALDSGPG